VGVLATMTVLIALEEIRQTDQRNDTKLILLASGALTQSLGLLIERFRSDNQPMHVVGRSLSIPDWVVNLRHGLAHGTGETNIDQLNIALDVVFDSLVDNPRNYWSQQAAVFSERTRALTKEEQNALTRLSHKLLDAVDKARKFEDGDVDKLLDKVRFFCEEQIYHDFFVALIVEHLMAMEEDTHQMDKWIKCIDELKYTPHVCLILSQYYLCNYECHIEVYSHSLLMKLLERLVQKNFVGYDQSQILPFVRVLSQVATQDTRNLLNHLKNKVDEQMTKRVTRVISLIGLMLAKRVNVTAETSKTSLSGWYEDGNKEWNNVPPGLRPGLSLNCLSTDLINQ